jgi:hypothetical protein
VVVGPAVWIADLLGLRLGFLSVRRGFLLMLAGLVIADSVALVHVALFSQLAKSAKWRWVHVMMLPFQMFAAFDYLIAGDRRQ